MSKNRFTGNIPYIYLKYTYNGYQVWGVGPTGWSIQLGQQTTPPKGFAPIRIDWTTGLIAHPSDNGLYTVKLVGPDGDDRVWVGGVADFL